MLRRILTACLTVCTIAAGAPALAQEEGPQEVLAQNKFLERNGKKEFSIQHFPSRNIFAVRFGLEWSNFDSATHSNGYRLTGLQDVKFIQPLLTKGCYLAEPAAVTNPVLGYLNGMQGGSNMISIVFHGDCQSYVDQLKTTPFIAVFKNVPAMTKEAPVTELLRVEVVETP